MGKSSIGWGGTDNNRIKTRTDFVERAYKEGNELGSHINGHFDGSKWTEENWDSDFKQFYHLIFDVYTINEIDKTRANPYSFDKSEIKGFRAPLLGQNPALYNVLAKYDFDYDTSKTNAMNYWPEKINGVWNFPLAQVRIAGTGIRTISMDYNFYFAQSKGVSNPSGYSTYYKQMLNTYLGYFSNNYNGNRAPVHIGHHFAKWNGSAYWDAMKEFAREVCGLPEVKCVTYSELVKFMEATPASTIKAYREKNFSPGQAIQLASADDVKPSNVNVALAGKNGKLNAHLMIAKTLTDELTLAPEKVRYEWSVNGQKIRTTDTPTLELASLAPMRLDSKSDISVTLIDSSGNALSTSTHAVQFQNNATEIVVEGLEDIVMKGDLPEAHQEEQE